MNRCIFILLWLFSVPCLAETRQVTRGDCSPNLSDIQGGATVICNITPYRDKGIIKDLKFVEKELPRNNENEKDTKEIISFFDQLQTLDDEIVYVRIYTYVGAGIGLSDVPNNKRDRAGVIFDLTGDVMDGFGGEPRDYKYGYAVQLNEYRKQWDLSRTSTILFPGSGNAFFNVHYGKSMSLDGLAKIRISDIQGFQFIEIVPVQPFGDLMDKYDQIRERIPRLKHSEF